MPEAIPLIANPTAGRGRARAKVRAAAEQLTAAGIGCELVWTGARGDVERFVERAASEGREKILVAGGDGSVHEAVNGLLNTASAAALGVIPVGTGNDFAKAASIPLDWKAAVARLAERLGENAPVVRVDAGRMNDRYFANGAGIGFDAEVAAAAARYRLPIGDAVYALALMSAASSGLKTPSMRVCANGNRNAESRMIGPALLVNVANGAYEGGRFRLAPAASIDDGCLDITHAKPVSFLRLLRLLPKLAAGSHTREPEVASLKVRSCRIDSEGPVLSHLDGELQEPADRFDIEVLSGALRLL